MARWDILQAYQVQGFAARFASGLVSNLVSTLSIIGDAFVKAINLDEYRPMIYVLDDERFQSGAKSDRESGTSMDQST